MEKLLPSPDDVCELRLNVQMMQSIANTTSAQEFCAKAVGTTWRTWVQWETGDRRMHPSFWQLACSKLIV